MARRLETSRLTLASIRHQVALASYQGLRVPAPKAQSAPSLDAATLAGIGQSLSSLFSGPLERSVPHHLLNFLEKLETPTVVADAADQTTVPTEAGTHPAAPEPM